MNNWSVGDIESRFNTEINATIPVVDRAKLGENEYVFTMSSEVLDRHGTVIRLSGAKIAEYNKNPIVLLMHKRGGEGWTVNDIIGKGYAFYEDGLLKNKITFEPRDLNEQADIVRRKIEFGSLSAGSIGFIPHAGSFGDKSRGEDEDIYYIRDWTLLEYSIVAVPSNPTALVEKKSLDTEIKEVDVDVELKEVEEDKKRNVALVMQRAFNKLRILKLKK